MAVRLNRLVLVLAGLVIVVLAALTAVITFGAILLGRFNAAECRGHSGMIGDR
jgi:hypothetical protein